MKNSLFKSSLLSLLLGVLASPFGPLALRVGADTFLVTKTTDDDGACMVDDCALREAVIASNYNPGMDVIEIPAGTYQLTLVGAIDEAFSMTGDLDIRDDLEIRGESAEAVMIVGTGTDRVMEFFAFYVGVSLDIEISGITVTGGRTISGGGGFSFGRAVVTISNSVIRGNTAILTQGGGIRTNISSITLMDSTVSDNTAGGDGGGIYVDGIFSTRGNLNVINSTISGNSSVYARGGGFFIADGDVNAVHTSIVANTALGDGSAIFGGVLQTVTFTNTLVEGDCRIPSFAPSISNGGNLESPGDTCLFVDPTDQINVPSPGLGPLELNGGPTPTHALLPGSAAIDTALDANCLSMDQRGEVRPFDGDNDGTAECDVGAYEFTGAPVTAIPVLDNVGLLVLTVLLSITGLAATRRRSGIR